MQRRQLVLGTSARLTALLLAGSATLAWAQRDEDKGEFTILQARYGTETNHVDVTARLRELARQDQRFKLTNELFGVDPDPGRNKLLRIFARDRQGNERSLDFRERDWVDGAQFIGWGAGRWGEAGWNGGWQGRSREERREDRQDSGEFTIQRATYGTPRREVDVTPKLRELARRDQRFRMGNDTFGVDPDPGRTKRLRIVTRDRRGKERSFEYREGSTVDGAQFVGWSGGAWGGNGPAGPVRAGRLVIESASYGTEGRSVDVTQALRAQLRGDRFEAEVNNELLGYDPSPGQRKLLVVSYRLNGGPVVTVRANERDTIRLP